MTYSIEPKLHCALYKVEVGDRLRTIQTLAVADSIRQLLLGIEGEYNNGEVGMTFSGHEASGDNQVGHQHAFIIPIDSNQNGLLDTVLIYAPLGFNIANLVALENLQAEAIFREDHLILESISHHPPAEFNVAHTHWTSSTPLLSFRHYKKSAGTKEDWWAKEVRRYCVQQGLPEPVSVRFNTGPKPHYWRDFRYERPSKRGNRKPFYQAVDIEFTEPVQGPILLGEHAHFGMGRMVPRG